MSNLLLVVFRSLSQFRLSAILSGISLALAGALIMTIFSVKDQSEEAFSSDRLGFDAVLGARGSQVQLILNAIFHLETSPGNLPWSLYKAIEDHPAVDVAIPYALGDNYQGFRIIGTTTDLFDKVRFTDGGSFELREGRNFDPSVREAVIGSFVAERTGLGVGSTFQPYHGLVYDPSAIHNEVFVVVGVLEPTNTPSDRVLWIPLEGIFRMEGHVLRGTGEVYEAERGVEIPDEHKEVSAVLLKLRNPQAGFALNQQINRQGTVATLAYPVGAVMADLFNKLGWMSQVLTAIAWLVLIVAAISNTAALLNTLGQRRRDLAILRAIGARRGFLFSAMMVESAFVATLAALAAVPLSFAMNAAAGMIIRQRAGIVIDPFALHPAYMTVPCGIIALGIICGIVPAYLAYRSDVAKNLQPIS